MINTINKEVEAKVLRPLVFVCSKAEEEVQ